MTWKSFVALLDWSDLFAGGLLGLFSAMLQSYFSKRRKRRYYIDRLRADVWELFMFEYNYPEPFDPITIPYLPILLSGEFLSPENDEELLIAVMNLQFYITELNRKIKETLVSYHLVNAKIDTAFGGDEEVKRNTVDFNRCEIEKWLEEFNDGLAEVIAFLPRL